MPAVAIFMTSYTSGGQRKSLLFHAHAVGLPAISAIVTYRIDEDDPDSQFGPPGDNFWGTPGVPARPGTAQQREFFWMGLVNSAHQANWPEHLPGLA